MAGADIKPLLVAPCYSEFIITLGHQDRLMSWLSEAFPAMERIVCSPLPRDRVERVLKPPFIRTSYLRSRELPAFLARLLPKGMQTQWCPQLWSQLRKHRPDVFVIGGYDSLLAIQLLIYAKLFGIPVVMVLESHGKSSRFRGGRGALWMLKRAVLSCFDRFVTCGIRSTESLLGYDISRSRISQGTNVVNVESIIPIYNGLPDDLKRSGGKCRFLYLGRLIARKGVMELLRAFRELPQDEAELVIIGYGPLEAEVQAYREQERLANVQILPACTSAESLVQAYAKAHVFVMPSLPHPAEVWGFVVNESLACGCYVLAGEASGSVPELIQQAPSGTGQAFDPEDHAEFVRALQDILAQYRRFDHAAIARWGQSFTQEKMGAAYVSAIRAAVDRGF